jgi:proton-coupled amino acid transporter
MTEPKELMKATHASLIVVFLTYVVIGDIISIIFVQGIQSDIISELPTSSALPTVIRLLMIITVLTTVPLIIIPAGDLIHDKIIQRQKGAPPGKSVYIVRLLIAIFCALVSVEVPKFIYVISFVGCFCVALTSFAYPPLLHLKCLYKFCSVEKRNSKMKLILTDVILLCCGVLITGFTSVLTFKSMMDQMKERKLY